MFILNMESQKIVETSIWKAVVESNFFMKHGTVILCKWVKVSLMNYIG